MADEEEQSITWQNFQGRKKRRFEKALDGLASRILLGHHNSNNLDLDIFPIVNTWNKIPFSYTTLSCSGTPSEHSYRNGYGIVNGYKGNPNAILFALSYMNHPLFTDFNSMIETTLFNKADISGSGPHSDYDYRGLYVHRIDVWVPEAIIEANNLEYLDVFWKEFNSELRQFIFYKERKSSWNNEPGVNI